MPKAPTAVIYCRKSDLSALPTDVSFDDQELCCQEYATKQGYSVGKVYRESHSGADLLHRTKIWEAIDDVRRGDAQILLVRNFDRLARKPEHQAVILYEIEEKCRGKVQSALEKVEDESTEAKTTRGILAVVAEAERLNAVARMQRGTRRRAERGELMPSPQPLYGYTWLDDEPGKRTTYEIDPTTGPVVQRMFKLATSGQSLRSIARVLNAEEVPTPSMWAAMHGRGGRRAVSTHWNLERVRNIINDHSYTGLKEAYRWVYKEGESGKRFQVRKPTGEIGTPIPPLVTQETWDTAQRLVGMGEHVGRPPQDKETTWLRKYVWCGVCGSRMHISHSITKNLYVYSCDRQRSRTFDKPCPGGHFLITAHLLDEPVYEALAAALERRKELEELMLKRLGTGKLEMLVAMSEGYEAQLKEKREEMATSRRRARQTKDDKLAQDFIDDAEQLYSEITALEYEYEEARQALENVEAESNWVKATLDSIYESRPIPTPQDVKEFPYEERRLLLAASGLRVEVFPKGWPGHDRIEVYLLSQSKYGLCHLIIRIHDLLS